MKRKASLSSALMEVAKPRVAAIPPKTESGDQQRPAAVPPSREGKKAIAGFFDPTVRRQLKQLGLESNMSVQDLLKEALNDLFEKHGMSRIA